MKATAIRQTQQPRRPDWLKWVFNRGVCNRGVHSLHADAGTALGLGATYRFPGDSAYPTGNNAATALPWAPITDGLRNITGRVNSDGTVNDLGHHFGPYSGNGDQGMDPNKLVAITDVLGEHDRSAGADRDRS